MSTVSGSYESCGSGSGSGRPWRPCLFGSCLGVSSSGAAEEGGNAVLSSGRPVTGRRGPPGQGMFRARRSNSLALCHEGRGRVRRGAGSASRHRGHPERPCSRGRGPICGRRVRFTISQGLSQRVLCSPKTRALVGLAGRIPCRDQNWLPPSSFPSRHSVRQ